MTGQGSPFQRAKAFVEEVDAAQQDGGYAAGDAPAVPVEEMRLLIHVATAAWDLHHQLPNEVDLRTAAPWFVRSWERLGQYLEQMDHGERR